MPRKARIDAPGALHHIICRGIERKHIFRDNSDRENFIDRLGNILIDTATTCYAWALIPNHLHLLLRTGSTPIVTVMLRLLTGHAVYFNRRHRRHGHLFQNRYKSILCQEDVYLLELVRYIHLNPIRAKLVPDMTGLGKHPYSGHSVLVGNLKNKWQDREFVLACFDKKVSKAVRQYRMFVEEGLGKGKHPELTGGGLIRSLGGWVEAKKIGYRQGRLKGDERILGDSAFVDNVLRNAEEKIDRSYKLKMQGYGLEHLVSCRNISIGA